MVLSNENAFNDPLVIPSFMKGKLGLFHSIGNFIASLEYSGYDSITSSFLNKSSSKYTHSKSVIFQKIYTLENKFFQTDIKNIIMKQ